MQFRLKKNHTMKVAERTTVSFDRDDLIVLARLVRAGRLLLNEEQRPLVITRLKAAMTRLGVPVPHDL
jgi:hypothetical protein